MLKSLPLILTLFRAVAGVCFVPLLLWRASAGWLLGLLVAGLLSDIADGIIARRLGVATLALRRLDTEADLMFYGCAVTTGLWKASFPLREVWPWLVCYGALFILRNAVDHARYRASPSYHMWSGKLWSMLLFTHLAALFCGVRAYVLLPLAFGCYAVNAAEGIAASLLLSQPSKDIPSVWHVWRAVKAER